MQRLSATCSTTASQRGALRCAATWCACCNKNMEPVLQHSVLCCNMMCCAATCCTVLQHGVLCCNMMCCVATGYRLSGNQHKRDRASDTHRSEYSHRVLWVLPQVLWVLPQGNLGTPTGYSGAHHRLSGGQRGRARGAPAACARARVCTAHTVRPPYGDTVATSNVSSRERAACALLPCRMQRTPRPMAACGHYCHKMQRTSSRRTTTRGQHSLALRRYSEAATAYSECVA